MTETECLFLHNGDVYTARDDYKCSSCNREIKDNIFWITKYFKKYTEHIRLCGECCIDYRKKKKVKGMVEEVRIVQVSLNIPKTAKIMFLKPPEITNTSKISVFEAANVKDGAKVIDKTVYAGRESFHGAQIGSDVSKLIEEKDAPLCDDVDIKELILEGENEVKGTDRRIEQKKH